MHARDQWFRLYVFTGYTPKIEIRDGAPIVVGVNPPTWEPSSEPLHVHHPDAYHPDARVRVQHQREMLKAGVALAACGAEHDPRMRFIEPHDPKDRCADCVAATERAKEAHTEAYDLLVLRARAAAKAGESP